jgi:hypothetical protein
MEKKKMNNKFRVISAPSVVLTTEKRGRNAENEMEKLNDKFRVVSVPSVVLTTERRRENALFKGKVK